MRYAIWERAGLRIAVGLLLCIAAGCSHDDEGAATAVAARVETPAPFATRSWDLIEGGSVHPTPLQPFDAAGGAGDRQPPSVSVTADAEPDSGGVPLTVNFSAEVEGATSALHYRWDFGDHSPPAHQLNVQHTYTQTGEYTATFTATGAGVDEMDDVSIEVDEQGFDLAVDADPDIGYAPLTVQFSAVLDDDLPGPFYYQWDFGDGGRDVSNPTAHTYRSPGEFTATLTVTNGVGQMATQDVEIQVDPRETDTGVE